MGAHGAKTAIREPGSTAGWVCHLKLETKNVNHYTLAGIGDGIACDMANTKKLRRHIEYHKDGSVWAKGQMAGGVPTGYWKWFRKDGTLMRSGTFQNGVQFGEWTTYDKTGAVYKVSRMKPLSTARRKKPLGSAKKGR